MKTLLNNTSHPTKHLRYAPSITGTSGNGKDTFQPLFTSAGSVFRSNKKMISKCLSILVGLLFLFPAVASAQQSNLGNTPICFVNKAFVEGFNWQQEVKSRDYITSVDMGQFFFRPGFGYKHPQNSDIVLMKYGSIPVENYLSDYLGKEADFEGTNKQRFIMEPKAINVNLLESHRIEQLFFENDFKLGMTYFPSLYVLINNESIADGAFYQSSYDELFLNSEETEFDTTYVYAGLGHMMTTMAGFESGYKTHIMPLQYIDPIYTVAFINF